MIYAAIFVYYGAPTQMIGVLPTANLDNYSLDADMTRQPKFSFNCPVNCRIIALLQNNCPDRRVKRT